MTEKGTIATAEEQFFVSNLDELIQHGGNDGLDFPFMIGALSWKLEELIALATKVHSMIEEGRQILAARGVVYPND